MRVQPYRNTSQKYMNILRLEDPADPVVYNNYTSRRVPVPSLISILTLPVMVVAYPLRVRRTAPRRVDNISFQPSARPPTTRPVAPRSTFTIRTRVRVPASSTRTTVPVRAPVRTVPPPRVVGAPPPRRASVATTGQRGARVAFKIGREFGGVPAHLNEKDLQGRDRITRNGDLMMYVRVF